MRSPSSKHCRQDRESFIELKDVLKVDIDGNVIGKEKHKRLIDAFIEDCKAHSLHRGINKYCGFVCYFFPLYFAVR